MVPYAIPFLGSAIAYGIDPIKFMQENYEKVDFNHLFLSTSNAIALLIYVL